jgi:hypothetical protein
MGVSEAWVPKTTPAIILPKKKPTRKPKPKPVEEKNNGD